MVTEFAGGTNEAGAIGWAQPRGAGFGVDGFQFPAGAQHHPAGQREPRDRQDRFVAFHPPLQTLGACVGSHRFKLRHALRHTMSDAIFNQCLPRNSAKSHTEGLTHKPLYANLRPYGMKNETKLTPRDLFLLLLIAAVVIVCGLLEINPNH